MIKINLVNMYETVEFMKRFYSKCYDSLWLFNQLYTFIHIYMVFYNFQVLHKFKMKFNYFSIYIHIHNVDNFWKCTTHAGRP